jgi:hypothetical protein
MNKKSLIILIYLVTGFLLAGAFLSLRIYNSLEDNIQLDKEIIKSFFFRSLIQSYVVILFPFGYAFYKNLKSNN